MIHAPRFLSPGARRGRGWRVDATGTPLPSHDGGRSVVSVQEMVITFRAIECAMQEVGGRGKLTDQDLRMIELGVRAGLAVCAELLAARAIKDR